MFHSLEKWHDNVSTIKSVIILLTSMPEIPTPGTFMRSSPLLGLSPYMGIFKHLLKVNTVLVYDIASDISLGIVMFSIPWYLVLTITLIAKATVNIVLFQTNILKICISTKFVPNFSDMGSRIYDFTPCYHTGWQLERESTVQ